MPYNYPHPSWKYEDRTLINALGSDLEYFNRIAKKYAFDNELRKTLQETAETLKERLVLLLNEYEENYAEPYNKPS